MIVYYVSNYYYTDNISLKKIIGKHDFTTQQHNMNRIVSKH